MDSGMCSGKYREHRQTKRCTDNSPCFCGSHSIYHRDHQRGGGPLLLFMAWFAAAVLVAVMVDHMSEGQPVFAGLILTAVALFAVLNLKYTYYEAATTQDNLKEYQEVADYLTEAGIDYGYAEFWDAERICLITDGRVTMGHSYTMASLSGYWWLTSTKWYPPTLPTEMRTAYVVRTEMREAFEQQFPEGEAPILEYENEKLAVYVGDRNYVEL